MNGAVCTFSANIVSFNLHIKKKTFGNTLFYSVLVTRYMYLVITVNDA